MSYNSKKSSVAWDFYNVKYTDDSTAICKLCNTEISRGSAKDRRFSTSALITHLRSKHSSELTSAENDRKQHSSSSLPAAPATGPFTGDQKRKRWADTTLDDVLEKKQMWNRNHPSAVTATKHLAEMIAIDLQPYSIVENVGFQRYSRHLEPRYALPSRRQLSENILPDMYVKLKDSVKKSIVKAKKVSFTTDIWTETNTTNAFIGVSAHWISQDWERKFAVLCCESFSGRHTGEKIAAKFDSVLSDWGIRKEVCHVVIRDNAANMVKAFQSANINSIGCSLHTFQLSIHDCIFDQRAVSDALAICRRLVGHFKHSALSSQRLADIQRDLQCEVLRPVQDVCTRWNSTYYMIERLLKIKSSISVFCSETDGMQEKTLTANMWNLLENVKNLLEPIEMLTRDLSAHDACLSSVIPAVLGLKLALNADSRDAGVGTMKLGLLTALDDRFSSLSTVTSATSATALDPRFKLLFFQTDALRDVTRSEILNAALALSRDDAADQSDSAGAAELCGQDLTAVDRDDGTAGDGTENHDIDIWSALWKFGNSAAASASAGNTSTSLTDSSVTVKVNVEVTTYFSEPVIPPKENPLLWWKCNQHRFPVLARLAQAFLAAPPSSVQSERIFSTAGDVYGDHRARLLPDNADKLIFLKFNLPLVNYKY